MNFQFDRFVSVLAVTIVHAGLTVSATAQSPQVTEATRDVKRWDPIKRELVPVEDIQPGLVYSHWHDRLGRRVWAIANAESGFDYAMGERSTIPVSEIDLPYSTEELEEMIEVGAPEWAAAAKALGAQSHARLDDQNEWSLVPHLTIKSIYDLETGRRWEWHGNRRVAVQHTGGYLWSVRNDRYVPHAFGCATWAW